jgi:AcrR family transcriptional regulator
VTLDTSAIRRLTPEMRREQTRTFLLEAAAAVFAARGFHSASLAEIADAAGFTTGAIYSNFGSKEDLFLAVVEARRAATLDEFFGVDVSADPDTRIAAIADVYRRMTTSVAEFALWQEFTLYALRNPAVRDKLSADLDLTVSALVELLHARQQTTGATQSLPEEALARLYIAIFDGIGRQRAIQPDAVPDELFATLVEFVDEAASAHGSGRRPPPG